MVHTMFYAVTFTLLGLLEFLKCLWTRSLIPIRVLCYGCKVSCFFCAKLVFAHDKFFYTSSSN